MTSTPTTHPRAITCSSWCISDHSDLKIRRVMQILPDGTVIRDGWNVGDWPMTNGQVETFAQALLDSLRSA
jgi:hypothetical protein